MIRKNRRLAAKMRAQNKMNRHTMEMIDRLRNLGLSLPEAIKLRRAAMTLHRWAELECGDGNDYASWAIERDEETGKPFMCTYPHNGATRRSPVADREAGALRAVKSVLNNHPDLWSYHQTDPRGASLYIGRKSDVKEGDDLSAVYTRGVA